MVSALNPKNTRGKKKNLIFKMYIFIQALSLYSLTLSNFLSFTWVFLLSLGQFSSDGHFTKPYTEATLAHTHSLLDHKVFLNRVRLSPAGSFLWELASRSFQ